MVLIIAPASFFVAGAKQRNRQSRREVLDPLEQGNQTGSWSTATSFPRVKEGAGGRSSLGGKAMQGECTSAISVLALMLKSSFLQCHCAVTPPDRKIFLCVIFVRI